MRLRVRLMRLVQMGSTTQPKHLPTNSVSQRITASTQAKSRELSNRARRVSLPTQSRAQKLFSTSSAKNRQTVARSRYRALAWATRPSFASQTGSRS